MEPCTINSRGFTLDPSGYTHGFWGTRLKDPQENNKNRRSFSGATMLCES